MEFSQYLWQRQNQSSTSSGFGDPLDAFCTVLSQVDVDYSNYLGHNNNRFLGYSIPFWQNSRNSNLGDNLHRSLFGRSGYSFCLFPMFLPSQEQTDRYIPWMGDSLPQIALCLLPLYFLVYRSNSRTDSPLYVPTFSLFEQFWPRQKR